jgi:hypothetical protein
MTAPRVYVAHPMTCYGTTHARSCLDGIARALPACELVDPEALAWTSHEAWLVGWRDILGTLAGLVVFAARDGTIGAGCLREIGDALDARVPVAAYARDGGLMGLADFDLLPEGERTARRYGTLLLAGTLRLPWPRDGAD